MKLSGHSDQRVFLSDSYFSKKIEVYLLYNSKKSVMNYFEIESDVYSTYSREDVKGLRLVIMLTGIMKFLHTRIAIFLFLMSIVIAASFIIIPTLSQFFYLMVAHLISFSVTVKIFDDLDENHKRFSYELIALKKFLSEC